MPLINNAPVVFFHVGLPKTASTFLQRNIFPHFKGIQFVKKHDFKHHEKIISTTTAPAVLLSIELDLDGASGYEKMAKIAKDYPGSIPIIVFRQHGSWVGSKYKYYLRKHGTLSFEEYFNMDTHDGVLTDKNLQFFEKIELLQEHYRQRPLVMFQEEFKNEPIKAIKILSDFVGATFNEKDLKISNVKTSYSEHSLYYVRKLNRWYKYDHSSYKTYFSRTLYKKVSGGVLHTVAFFTGLFEPNKEKAKKVLPKASVKRINDKYASDWQRCIDFAAETREVYLK